MPDERPSASLTLVAGVQHVGHVQPNGACPTPYGLRSECLNSVLGLGHAHDPIVGGKVPSYLGSSFAFIGPVLAATGATVGAPNPNIPLALGGIIAAGALYTLIGLIVQVAGHRWVERLM